MRKTIFTILVSLTSLLSVKGQEKKDLAVSVSSGLLNSPVYDKATAREFLGVEFDYHLTGRHVLTASYLAGRHNYYEDELSNAPTYRSFEDGTNAVAGYNVFSVMYKYKLFNNSQFSIAPGIGAGIMNYSREYPYMERTSWYTRRSSGTDLVFPVNLDISYKISGSWQFGLTGGFFVQPDYPILALYAGPKLTFIVP